MRATILHLAVLVTVAVAPAAEAHAQSAPASVGERVRVATAARHGEFSYVGRVVAAHGDSLNVQVGGAEGIQVIPVSEITNLEVSVGTETHGRRGMLYGSAIGGVSGAIIGAITYKKPDCSGAVFFCGSPDGGRGLDTFAGFIAGGVIGLGVGGIIGISRTTERWIGRPLGSGGRVGITPARGGGTAVSVSVRF